MKTYLLGCVLLTLWLASGRHGYSETIASDQFAYPDGLIAGCDGGTGFARPYSGNGQISAGSLIYIDATGHTLRAAGSHVSTNTSGHGMNRTLNTKDRTAGLLDAHDMFGADGSTIYIAFLARLDAGDVTSFGDYGGLSLFDDGTEQLFIGDPGFFDTWTFWGIDPEEGPDGVHESEIPVDGTVHLLVARIDFATAGATVRLYIDPPLGAEPATATIAPFPMHGFRFNRVRLQGGGNGLYSFDELTIATTYKEAVPIDEHAPLAPPPPATPKPAPKRPPGSKATVTLARE